MTSNKNKGLHFFCKIKAYTAILQRSMVNGQWFIVSYDSANKQKHHKSHRMQ